jgi:hypothetical protein
LVNVGIHCHKGHRDIEISYKKHLARQKTSFASFLFTIWLLTTPRSNLRALSRPRDGTVIASVFPAITLGMMALHRGLLARSDLFVFIVLAPPGGFLDFTLPVGWTQALSGGNVFGVRPALLMACAAARRADHRARSGRSSGRVRTVTLHPVSRPARSCHAGRSWASRCTADSLGASQPPP